MCRIVLSMALAAVMCSTAAHAQADEQKLRVLIVDGQNNHDWQVTTPILRRILEQSGRFMVEVATTPAEGGDMTAFRPSFAEHDVVLSNYNGDPWSPETQQALTEYIKDGGGFVCVHAANNAFPDWPEYNEMIGLGGWGGRNERSGPFVYFVDGRVVRDPSPGPGGHHGKQREFAVVVRDADHPITRGMPTRWMHTKDELYDQLRGPAREMTILASAFADPASGGSGREEPMMWTVRFGKGRVFHTVLGHADYSMKCVGFITSLERGTQWAATGEVTLPIPEDFPSAEKSRSRDVMAK